MLSLSDREMSGRIYKHLCLKSATRGEVEGGSSLRLGQEGAALGLQRVPERTWTPHHSRARPGTDHRCESRLCCLACRPHPACRWTVLVEFPLRTTRPPPPSSFCQCQGEGGFNDDAGLHHRQEAIIHAIGSIIVFHAASNSVFLC
jgi:hypothetical protein